MTNIFAKFFTPALITKNQIYRTKYFLNSPIDFIKVIEVDKDRVWCYWVTPPTFERDP
jgi:hypothetical protein